MFHSSRAQFFPPPTSYNVHIDTASLQAYIEPKIQLIEQECANLKTLLKSAITAADKMVGASGKSDYSNVYKHNIPVVLVFRDSLYQYFDQVVKHESLREYVRSLNGDISTCDVFKDGSHSDMSYAQKLHQTLLKADRVMNIANAEYKSGLVLQLHKEIIGSLPKPASVEVPQRQCTLL